MVQLYELRVVLIDNVKSPLVVIHIDMEKWPNEGRLKYIVITSRRR